MSVRTVYALVPVSTRPVSSCLVSSCLDLFVCVYPCLFVCLLVCFLAFRFLGFFFWFGWLVVVVGCCGCCRWCVAVAVDVCALVVFVWWLWVVVGSVSLFGCVGWYVCLGLLGLVWACVCWEEGNGCMHRTRLRVYVQNVSVCTGSMPTCFIHVGLVPVHTRTFWMYTRRRFERAHGFFSTFFHRAATHKNTNTHHDHPTTPRPQRHHDHTTQHGDRNRERKRETRQDKKRGDETRQGGKTREERRWKRRENLTQHRKTHQVQTQ